MRVESANAVVVILHQKRAQMSQMPDQFFGERKRLANKASYTLAQSEVEAFHMVSFSCFFAARVVLGAGRGRDDLLISTSEVAITAQRLVIGRYFVPQRKATHLIARPEVPRHHLARAAAQSNPDPHLVFLVANIAHSSSSSKHHRPEPATESLAGKARQFGSDAKHQLVLFLSHLDTV